MSAPMGTTNIFNLAPEVPVQALEDYLSTPMFNLIHSFGVDLYHAEAYLGKTTRMSRMERLSTEGGELDGSGIDPASEVPVRTDIDAKMEIYAKAITVNEQVILWENPKTYSKFTALLGQLTKSAVLKPLVIDLEARWGDRAQAELYALAA